uniref:Caspase n=1 Tax=Penaeus japonicus TaxID=27405 RepID=D7PKR2_PENJP|nr:caspase [Penaeus japonicus]
MDEVIQVTQWLSSITPRKKAKLFFFTTHADAPSPMVGSNDVDTHEETQLPLATTVALHNFKNIDEFLKKKVNTFSCYNVIENETTKTDYEYLRFYSACKYLDVVPPFLDLEKISAIQNKFEMTDEERDYRLLLDSADLVLEKVCDSLKPAGVSQMWTALRKDRNLIRGVKTIDIIGFFVDPNPTGIKECLFFFIVRFLQKADKINRVNTNRLERLIAQCDESSSCEEGKTIDFIIDSLRFYPTELYPFGFCLIMCVIEGRDGAMQEIEKTMEISRHLGMITHTEKNPTKETIELVKKELMKPKYQFYSSFTCWFMSHGDSNSMVLADGETIEREWFLTSFPDISTFQLKPKVFFMVSCRGANKFSLKGDEFEGQSATCDYYDIGSALIRNRMLDITDSVRDISYVQPMMDTLVAYSTILDHLSGRANTHGSIYVDRACVLMSENISRGRSLTEILEHLSQDLHEILRETMDEDRIVYKQACHYDSFFRKTLKLPYTRHPKEDVHSAPQ